MTENIDPNKRPEVRAKSKGKIGSIRHKNVSSLFSSTATASNVGPRILSVPNKFNVANNLSQSFSNSGKNKLPPQQTPEKDKYRTPPPKLRCSQTYFQDSSINRILQSISDNRSSLRYQNSRIRPSSNGGTFFIYGSGGCGKTYLWKTLIFKLRAERKIVLPVASSGIAAVLLPGGRTAHSRFHLPLLPDSSSTCGIKKGSEIAELIQHTDLIIWDEAPMQHRHLFEAVDRSLRDIMSQICVGNKDKPFGGITILFGGDFRQILPVIPKASRAEIVNASLTQSHLWNICSVYHLKQNMRLHQGNTTEENQAIQQFSDWVLAVGDGRLPTIYNEDITSDPQILIPDEYIVYSEDDKLQDLIDIIYPNLQTSHTSHSYLSERAILAPTNQIVNHINDIIINQLAGERHTYLSVDKIDEGPPEENDLNSAFPVEFLNSITIPGLPNHELQLKVGVVVMLMRNLNQVQGLCNGTRMIVTKCLKNTVECEIITGNHAGERHIIPKIIMVPTDTHLPFEFSRKQIPLQVCFAMTINKSQGQSLETVGLYLPKPVFCHGQLYVAISRVTSPKGLHILIEDDDGLTSNVTKNIVYEEVFYNISENIVL